MIRATIFRPAVVTAALVAIGTVLGASTSPAADNWPQFRGPGSRGVSDETDLPDSWSRTENVVWTAKIPGRGWSSPVIWGDRIFLTSAEQLKGKTEKVKPGLYFGGERSTPYPHRWSVYCIDFKTGKILWSKVAHEGVPLEGHHLKNTFASETPVTDGERVYAYFGNVGLFAYDLDGKLLWKKDLGKYKTAYSWGTASSPVLHGDRIFIVDDNEEHSFVTSIDTKTGNEVWRVDRKEKSNWATPYIWENDLRTELVTCGKGKVRSYSLDGKLLWELDGMSSIVIPTPFSVHDLLYVTSGYVMSVRKPIFAIKPGAKGDISLKGKETRNEFIAWFQAKGGPYNVSPIVYEKTLYVLYDRGFLSAFDALTGKSQYQPPMVRLGGSSEYTASPWAYNGKIFCLSEHGDTTVIAAGGTKPEVLRTNELDELCMATPATARGSLFIRTETQLYRIAKKQ
jgi:outer membrane protein assembly factor BamB